MKKHLNGITELPDGSGFFVDEIDPKAPLEPPIRWNVFNKVVQDHCDGTINHEATNKERAARGLPTPWTPEMARTEVHEAPVF